jgi:hypothetical protein
LSEEDIEIKPAVRRVVIHDMVIALHPCALIYRYSSFACLYQPILTHPCRPFSARTLPGRRRCRKMSLRSRSASSLPSDMQLCLHIRNPYKTRLEVTLHFPTSPPSPRLPAVSPCSSPSSLIVAVVPFKSSH